MLPFPLRPVPKHHVLLKPTVQDLFGEIPVTWPEVWAWIEAVPHISRHSWRSAYYAKHWHVADKVKTAKLNGTFHATVNQRDTTELNTLESVIAHLP